MYYSSWMAWSMRLGTAMAGNGQKAPCCLRYIGPERLQNLGYTWSCEHNPALTRLPSGAEVEGMNEQPSPSALGGPSIRTDDQSRTRNIRMLIEGILETMEAHPASGMNIEALSHVRGSCSLLRHCLRRDATAIATVAQIEQWAAILYSARK